LLPTDEQISWQGHLFGFAGGMLAAVITRRRRDELEPDPTTASARADGSSVA
jgi:membrane associated rhomboid family serine protease